MIEATMATMGLTIIRQHPAIYFLGFPGRSAQKAAWRECAESFGISEAQMIRGGLAQVQETPSAFHPQVQRKRFPVVVTMSSALVTQ
jgi:hypothetical protein